VCLVTFVPAHSTRPFKAHPLAVVAAQARALNLPHKVFEVSEPYLESYQGHIASLREELGVDALATGDIEDVCSVRPASTAHCCVLPCPRAGPPASACCSAADKQCSSTAPPRAAARCAHTCSAAAWSAACARPACTAALAARTRHCAWRAATRRCTTRNWPVNPLTSGFHQLPLLHHSSKLHPTWSSGTVKAHIHHHKHIISLKAECSAEVLPVLALEVLGPFGSI
jgi:hypothetical protein